MTPSELLYVVMPAYNEEACLPKVIDAWMPELRRVANEFRLLVLNDGSKDRTLEVLRELARRHPELIVVDKPNSGHGQSCVEGYRRAVAAGARWVLQIDSDGQCDPRFFEAVWSQREAHPVVYGYRKKRGDGLRRHLISRAVSVAVLLGGRTWVRDPNVPYRLMRRDAVEAVLPQVPADFHLANVLVAALQQRRFGIHWVDIEFRERIGGTPSVKSWSFVKEGARLMRQLTQARH